MVKALQDLVLPHHSSVMSQLPPFPLWPRDTGFVSLPILVLQGNVAYPVFFVSQRPSPTLYLLGWLFLSIHSWLPQGFPPIVSTGCTFISFMLISGYYVCVILWLMSGSPITRLKASRERKSISFLFTIVSPISSE